MRSNPTFLSAVLILTLAIACQTPERLNAQADGTQRWAFSTLSTSAGGNILSSPSSAPDGTVYIGVEVGLAKNPVQTGLVFAITPAGAERWRYATPDWVDSTPAIAEDGTVYFGCWDGKLYALRPDGSLKWSTGVGSFVSASPAIGTDGTVYTGSGEGFLHAVNPDGTLKWLFAAVDWIESSPVIGPDGTIYFGSWDKSVYAVRPDGRRKWSFTTGGNVVASPTLGVDGTVYVGSRDLVFYAIKPDGTLKWSAALGDTIESSAAIGADGSIIVATTGGRVFAFSPDGTERWRYPAAGQASISPLYSSPAVRSDGSILLGTGDNALCVLNQAGTLRMTVTLGDWADSSPLITPEGMIYIGCYDKKLYAFNGAFEPAGSDWPQARRDPRRTAWQPSGVAAGTTGRLVNLSVRTTAGSGDNILIVGFVVSGSGSRSLLVRGIGPTLANYGVSGVLGDPVIAALSGSTVIGTNDNWGEAPNLASLQAVSAMVSAFALPAGSLDAALLRDFTAGGYTVQVGGSQGTTGIALTEVYDGGGQGNAGLGNVSARSVVSSGAGVLIAGFVIGDSPRAVLVRGIGPTLGDYGVPGVLADARLTVFKGTQVIASNDNWASSGMAATVAQQAGQVYAFPLSENSKDAALLLTLSPGAYSAQVSGVGGVGGIGLVEIYALP